MAEGKSVHLGQISWSIGICDCDDWMRGEGLKEKESKSKDNKILNPIKNILIT